MKKLPLYVALDVDDINQALHLAKKTAPYTEGFKIGPRLFLRAGPSLISQLRSYGKVFLDLKFFDIPSTMLSAVQSAFEKGADMVTIHAGAGETTLKQLSELEACLNAKRPFRILCVTVLTSFQQENLPPLAKAYSLSTHVESLANMVIKSGLKGIVCSGHEVATLRKKYPTAYILTPGLRPRVAEDRTCPFSIDRNSVPSLEEIPVGMTAVPAKQGNDNPYDQRDPLMTAVPAKQGNDNPYDQRDPLMTAVPAKQGSAKPDQKRVCTPQSALLAGANALVMGRPIYQAKDPAQVCVQLQTELADFL